MQPPPNQHQWQLPPLRNIMFNDDAPLNNTYNPFMPPPVMIPVSTLSRHNSYDHSPLSCSASSILSGTSVSSYSESPFDRSYGSLSSSLDLPYPEPYTNFFNNASFPTVAEDKQAILSNFDYSSSLPPRNEFSESHYDSHCDQSPTPMPYSAVETLPTDIRPEQTWTVVPPQNIEQATSPTLKFPEIKIDPSEGELELANSNTDLAQVVSNESQGEAPAYALSLYHLSPRMQYLLNYYDKAICPVLVAFDTPANPYRMYIMQLAADNDGLQNAIAALVTNNMRMRDPQNLPCLTNSVEFWQSDSGEAMATPTEGPSAEEQYYKTKSIEHLNSQLANAFQSRDDSVLATLLILCLFHICDSGVAKFKTQLAGVQKLLRMRGQVFHSEFVDWVEMFFAWLDVMTSCVNDREIQVHGDSVDLMNLSAHLGALEQYSGCDGRLFKLIARLGRLNLLSQSRPVREASDVTPRGSPQLRGLDQCLPPISFAMPRTDAMGMGSPHSSPDVLDFQDSPESHVTDPDGRSTFWREWRDLRRRLLEWDATYYYGPMMSYEELPSPQRDLVHISEAFRYSALLYVERLAYPDIPSASRNFQDLVAQSLYHIMEIPINSCVLKFMLWPMFITGTECVEKAHRDAIRIRCVEIQRESGFYNNLRGLRVLERAWKQNDDCNGIGMPENIGGSCGGTTTSTGRSFWWQNAMERVDGEYIVI